MLSIHLTDICNNRCWFCVVDSPKQKTELVDRGRIERFLELHKDKGYSAVNIHGGEPTIRKDFLEVLTRIVELGYPQIILQTNGRSLADNEFAERVCHLGVGLFVISVHGSCTETHELITQVPNSFEQALKGISNIKQCGARVRTNSVVSKLNYTDIPETMRLLLQLGVDHINISALHTAGAAFRYFEKVTPTYDESIPFVRMATDIVNQTGTPLTLEGFPLCVIRGLHKHLIDWQNQRFKMLFRGYVFDDYESYMDRTMRIHGKVCTGCGCVDKCGGVYKEYIDARGWEEFGACMFEAIETREQYERTN